MKKFLNEFKGFALKGNMMDMAVGIIIGTAFSGLVSSLTDNFINPILKFITAGAHYSWQDVAGFISTFISALINFIIMAFVLFCMVKAINKFKIKSNKKEVKTSKTCPYCFSDINLKAVKCPHCTADLKK